MCETQEYKGTFFLLKNETFWYPQADYFGKSVQFSFFLFQHTCFRDSVACRTDGERSLGVLLQNKDGAYEIVVPDFAEIFSKVRVFYLKNIKHIKWYAMYTVPMVQHG